MAGHSSTFHRGRWRGVTRFRVALVALAVALLLVLLTPAAAGAKVKPAGKASISGAVTDAASGKPLAGVTVTAYLQVPDTGSPNSFRYDAVASTATSPKGKYTVDKLAAGTYHVHFRPPDPAVYALQVWRGRASLELGDDVVLAERTAAKNVDAALEPIGTPAGKAKASISGAVTDAASGKPVAGVTVAAYLQVVPDPAKPGEYRYDAVASATTSHKGTYKLDKLAAGTYHVEFRPAASTAYAPETWSGRPALELGDDVVLAERTARTGVDAALDATSTFSGKVTNLAGVPVADVTVTAYLQFSPDPQWPMLFDYEAVASATTTSTGTYSISGLAAGTYHVDFWPPDLIAYALEAWRDQAAVGVGDDIVVTTPGPLTGIDAVLDPSGTLRGTITDPEGKALAGMSVNICYQTPGIIANLKTVTTDTNGDYSFSGLKEFEFFPWAFDPAGWHRDAMAYPEQGDVVPVGGVKEVELVLAPAGKVTGRVLGPSGEPVQGVSVAAYSRVDYGGGEFYWEQVTDFVKTDADGSYTIAGLGVGNAHLGFTDPPLWRFARTCYGGAPIISESTPIPVTGGVTTKVDDVTLSADRGTITGTVTDGHGATLPWCDVTIELFSGGESSVAVEYTLADGVYGVDGLPYGDYKVSFNRQGNTPNLSMVFDNDWFDQHPTPVTVNAAGTSPASVDAALPLPSLIRGTVTGHDVGPLAGIQVMAVIELWPLFWWDVAWSQTDEYGAYSLPLPAGDYRVRFEDENGDWVPEAWNDVLRVEDGVTIQLAAETTASGKDAELAPAGHIRGHLSVPDGAGYTLEDVWIVPFMVVNGQFGECVGGTTASETGDFDLGGLPFGEYVLDFQSRSGGGSSYEWYDDSASWEAATRIFVDAAGQWPAADHSGGELVIDDVVDDLMGGPVGP
jgi:DNA gyrase inhibitor GyrI